MEKDQTYPTNLYRNAHELTSIIAEPRGRGVQSRKVGSDSHHGLRPIVVDRFVVPPAMTAHGVMLSLSANSIALSLRGAQRRSNPEMNKQDGQSIRYPLSCLAPGGGRRSHRPGCRRRPRMAYCPGSHGRHPDQERYRLGRPCRRTGGARLDPGARRPHPAGGPLFRACGDGPGCRGQPGPPGFRPDPCPPLPDPVPRPGRGPPPAALAEELHLAPGGGP